MSKMKYFQFCGIIGLTLVIIIAAMRLAGPDSTSWADPLAPSSTLKETATVNVKVFNDKGTLVGPVPLEKVQKTTEQWRKQLTNEQFHITREHGTERPFTGQLLNNKDDGVYTCVACGLPLYTQNAKFDSGTGWPSFFQAIAEENVAQNRDESLGMVRIEIHCARCDAHLGHVFPDGPKPTGKRHCVNAASLAFTKISDVNTLADPITKTKSLVLAGGCFWCTEAVFEQLKGVHKVVSGYAGGSEKNANYQAVCTGQTDHAEVIRITYDPSQIDDRKLLEIFLTVAHDPTQLNAQGPDRGRQYRSAIFYADEAQKKIAQEVIGQLEKRRHDASPIVTTLEPLVQFYPAEKYHQDYVRLHPAEPYVQAQAMPKVRKIRKKFENLVRPNTK